MKEFYLAEDMEIAMKILIVGNGSVGKSSMIQRFCRGIFTKDYKKTIGVDFLERVITIDDQSVRLMLWDTAGQEEFDCITRTYYRGANACVLACSITDRDSFNALGKWKSKVCRECGDIPMVLVANKIDLQKHPSVVVDSSELDSMAKSLGIAKLIKTSVKDDINVKSVFTYLAQLYMESVLSLTDSDALPDDDDFLHLVDDKDPHRPEQQRLLQFSNHDQYFSGSGVKNGGKGKSKTKHNNKNGKANGHGNGVISSNSEKPSTYHQLFGYLHLSSSNTNTSNNQKEQKTKPNNKTKTKTKSSSKSQSLETSYNNYHNGHGVSNGFGFGFTNTKSSSNGNGVILKSNGHTNNHNHTSSSPSEAYKGFFSPTNYTSNCNGGDKKKSHHNNSLYPNTKGKQYVYSPSGNHHTHWDNNMPFRLDVIGKGHSGSTRKVKRDICNIL